MSKYIIEIKPEYEDTTKGIMVLGARDSKLFVDTVDVANLEVLNSDYVNEHYGDLQDTAYQKGFEDGKAANDKGCEGCKWEGDATSLQAPCSRCCNYYKNRWKAKDDKIEVGDEVTHKSDSVKWKAIVTRISCGTLTLMEHNGAIADNYPIEDFVKTGRHFDIASILEDMKE